MPSERFDPKDKTLLVISGGGCAHIENAIGCLKAICETGVKFDMAYGTSAGALVTSIFMSKDQNVNEVIDLIERNSFSDWVRLRPIQAIKSLFGLSNYVADDTGLKHMLLQHITSEGAESTRVAVSRMTEDGKFAGTLQMDGYPSAVLASMSFQGVFPPVRIGGTLYADGGVNDNIPLPKFTDILKCKHLYILIAPESPLLPRCKKWSFLDKVLNLLDCTMNRESAQVDQLHLEELPNVTIIKPEKYTDTAKFLGWSDNFEQITASYEMTKKQLSVIKYPAVFPELPNKGGQS